MKKAAGFGSLLGILLLASPSWAHDVWLERKGDHLELVYGHAFPEVYNPIKVKAYQGFDRGGNPVALKRLLMDEAFALASDPTVGMITCFLDNGYWIVAPQSEWANVPPETAKSFASYEHALKYHKSLFAWAPPFARPTGMVLEIVPLKNPFEIKPGGLLPVRVLFQGQPLAGADVEYGTHGDAAPKATTDKDGMASLPIVAKTEQFFAVDHETSKTASGEKTIYATSLRYELK